MSALGNILRGLFKTKNQRILLVDFKGLSVFALDDGILTRMRRFSAEVSGYSEFRRYLSGTPATPVYMIVDSVAEDFLIETIAHVNARDRKLLIERKLDQNYRGGEYRFATVIGRETSGRRDDRVLFSALTRNQQIEPWIRCILQEEIPLISITSPAYVISNFANAQGYVTSPDVLIINWEQTGIRQTYVQNGKTVFSRLTPLQPPDDPQPLQQYIMRLADQSREYLGRIRLLEFEKPLDLHVFTPLLDEDSFTEFADNKDYSRIEHHNPEFLLKGDSFEASSDQITAILLCIDYAARQQQMANFYAPAAARRFYHLKQIRRSIYISCVVLVLGSGLLSMPVIIEALDRRESLAQLMEEIIPLQSQYQELRGQFPETPIPSQQMELVVVTKGKLEAQSESPNEMLATISQVISRDPRISLNRIVWSVVPVDPNLPLTQALLEESTELSIDISGEFLGTSGFRDIARRLQALIMELQTIPGTVVRIVAQPIMTSEDSSVITSVNDGELNSFFTLNLRRGFQQ